MSNEFWSTLNKKKREELLKSSQTKESSSQTRTSSSVSKSEDLKTSDFWSVLNEDRKQELMSSGRTFMSNDDDIAPVRKDEGSNKSAQTVETTQAIFDKYGQYYNSPDYDEYSKQGAAIKNPTVEEAEGWLTIGPWKFGDKEVGNIVTYSRDNVEAIAMGRLNSTKMVGNTIYRHMTDFEVGIYNYLLAKNGKDAAQEFLDDIEETLNAREGGMVAENIQNSGAVASTLLHGLVSVGSGMESAGTGLKQLFSEEALPTTATEFMNQALLEDLDGFAKQAYQAGNTVGNMLPSVAVGFISPTAGKILQSSSSAGNAYRQSLKEGKTKEEAATFGVIIGSLEYATNKALGGVAGMTGDIPKKALSKIATFQNPLLKVAAKYGVNLASEVTEEELQLWLEPLARSIAFGEDYDAPELEEMAETAIVTALSTGILNSSTDIATGNLTKVDGLTTNEARVVEKVYERRLAEESENKTLSNKDKNKLYESIVEQMEKGYISTDTIEEVLGGDEYKTYKDNLDTTSKLKKELEDLSIIERGKLNRKQEKRIEELEAMNLDDTTKLTELRKKLDDKLSPMLNGSKLAESYREAGRRNQAFTADLTQYTGKQKEAVERAIKSGVLNNTNRSHELVDILSKIEAEKGIVFDYADNKKLKETGFALEGKKVHGFVNNGTITLNVESRKAWQSTVGHEITHVLEGTEAYGALQQALFEYAESKGEYQSRYDSLAEVYNGVKGYETDFEAKIQKELTADLVGDYLFTDRDFINRLTGNRTLFQKVYDEIKYLCKVATGKELTEIEKVKREFDKVWKEQGQTKQSAEVSNKTQLSLSAEGSTDSKGNKLSPAVQKRFEKSKAVDENGKLKVLYHGTASGEFFTFDKSKGSVEGDFGSGFYFTDNESDVERNYEGGGADFENKVARRAEQIESEEDIEYSEAERRAREELYVGSNKFEVYLNIENPCIVGETNLFDYESFAEEYDRSDYDSDEDYEADVEYHIADEIDSIIWDINRNVDIYSTDGIAEVLWEAINEGGIDVEQLKANINNLYLEDSNGNLVGNEVTRQIIESLGYDGIIDNTVSSKFNMGLSEDTTHYIVFKPNQIKDISNQNPTDNPDIRYSLSKDIENFDNSWYNEIELPTVERDRVQSEALTWHVENKGQPFSMPLSNGFTYLCTLDNDGIVHIYGKKKSVNIHEFGGNYDNRNTERPDRYVEKYGNQQGIDIGDNVFDGNGREQIAPIASNGTTVQGEGQSNRTGYSKNGTYAYRKPKAIGWHLNDDGSVEVTYSDGTKEIEYPTPKKRTSSKDGVFSLSNEGEQFAPIGNYSTPLNETALEQDIAPVGDGVIPERKKSKSERIASGERSDELLYESLDNYPMKTVEQRIAEKLRATQGEIADNRDLRKEAEANYEKQIINLRAKYNAKKNKNTKEANKILQSISRLERLKASVEADFAKRISDLEARAEKLNDPKYARAMQKQAKMEADAKWAADLLGDTSTWQDKKIGLQYATNTERRNLRDIVRDANGNADIAKADAIDDALNGQYNRDEAAKKRELSKVRDKYAKLKITRAEDAYIQMLGEFRHNPDTTLTEKDISEYYEKHKSQIDTKKVDEVIELARQDYDSWLNRVNAELKKQGMKEIPYRQGYFPHFTEPKQNFIQKLLNWKTQDNEIPTSIAGLTETFKPTKSWQSFDKTRHSDKTDYSFMKGFDSYSEGALDWIYHMDTLQKRRAVENHIRFTHSDEGIKARIKEVYANTEMDANEAQAQIEHILAEAKNPLNNFVQDFTTHTNILAGKKNSLDRTVEQWTNRHIYSVMTNVQNRMSANMVLANVRSALTNFIPITQSWAQVSPIRSLQAAKETIANSFKDDGTVDKSAFLTNRLREADKLYQTNWDKVLDKAGIMFEVVDNFSSQVIWRSKYNQNLAEGMSEAEAIANADQFAENVMAGRSKGNEPTLFNAKNPLVKAFTMFQLEVNNQYGYLFKDVPNDLKTETNHWKLNLAKGYTTAFIGAYVYNALLEKVAGSGAALDPIGIIEELLKDLGLFGDDEEEEPDKVITNLIENVGGELPFVGGTLFGGGRIPISSALPYGDDGLVSGVSDFITDVTEGNWKNVGKEVMNPLLNVGLPVGGGQLKKTVQGLKMFSDEHPVSGSYTDSGNLRFPVEDTLGNRIQAGIFGQYASKNAREYFDNDYAPLKEKQIQEYQDVDLPIADYWKYREGLSGLKTNAEKADYINSLDIENWQKNLLLNNILDRKEDVDMSNYDDFSDWDEFDYAQKNPDKYAFAKSVGGYSAYKTYSDELYDIKADKDEYGKSISGSRKEKVLNYINNLDADYETKIILWKSEYPSDDTYNMEIINYINNRTDLTYEERVAIFTELGFTVSNGSVYWD